MTDADRARLAYLEAEYVRQGKLLAKYQRAVAEIAEAANVVKENIGMKPDYDPDEVDALLATIDAATTEGRG